MSKCIGCDGKGEKPCNDCHSTGTCLYCMGMGPNGLRVEHETCSYCHGSRRCPTCSGTKMRVCTQCNGTGES